MGHWPSERVWLPEGAWIETYDRRWTSSAFAQASGRMYLSAIWLAKGWELHSVVYASQGAATAPTHQWVAVYEPGLTLLGVTNDLLTTPWAANTLQTFPFATPLDILEPGVHYLGIVQVATTPASINVPGAGIAKSTIPPLLGFEGAAGLTTPATASNPAPTGGTVRGTAYAYVT